MTEPLGGDSYQHLLTVRDVLALDVMQGATVIAGQKGLERRVRGINIIEVPDVWQWLEGGELLLTAGYAWRERPEQMVGLVTKLHEMDVSAIAFKLGPYLDHIPGQVLRWADELRLPVIKLPASVPYREVLESLYGSLTSRPALLDLSHQARQAFIRSSLDEQSIEKVAATLARQLRCQTYVVDLLDEEVVAASGEGVSRTMRLEALDEPESRLMQSLQAEDLRRSPSEIALGDTHGLGAALVVGHRVHGYIVVVGGDKLDEAAAGAVAHAGELVSFLLMNRLALFEGRRQAGDVFLQSLISDTLSSEEAAERALTLGLRLTRPAAVFVVGFVGSHPDARQSLDVVARAIDRALVGTPHVLSAGPAGDTVLGLMQVSGSHDELLHRLETAVRGLAQDDQPWQPLIGTGSPGVGVEGVRRSRSEALIAFETGERLGQRGVVHFERLGVERLLAQIPKGPVAEGYVTSLLGPLEADAELLRTVEVYLQHGGNKVATAAAMPLHRSSLVYRLQKASHLLGVDLNSPERCLELWLAIRLRRILSLSGD